MARKSERKIAWKILLKRDTNWFINFKSSAAADLQIKINYKNKIINSAAYVWKMYAALHIWEIKSIILKIIKDQLLFYKPLCSAMAFAFEWLYSNIHTHIFGE